jgi:hypothetical protein
VKPLQLGKVVGTPAALRELERAGIPPASLLLRHQSGDFGSLSLHDQKANEQALTDGGRILSSYRLDTGVTIWLITEGTDDSGVRQSTCILLPDEY